MKAQGKAPVALRWERLRNRYDTHKQCVESVVKILTDLGASCTVIGREEMYRGSLVDKDLVVAVGGDGTVLNASSFLDETIPMLGVNSDPSRPEELGLTQKKDERRSRGALCAATANDIDAVLPRIINGEHPPGVRQRIRCIVRSTYTETKLPPSLNDILIAHPIPAAVSRFRIILQQENISYQHLALKKNDTKDSRSEVRKRRLQYVVSSQHSYTSLTNDSYHSYTSLTNDSYHSYLDIFFQRMVQWYLDKHRHGFHRGDECRGGHKDGTP